MNHGGKRYGAGRPKGSPNKFTAEIKGTILEAFERAGGVDYLADLAINDPRTFCALLGKCIPAEGKADPAGEGFVLNINVADEPDITAAA